MRYFDYYRKGKVTIAPAMEAIHAGLAQQGLERSKSRDGSRFDFALCWGQRQDTRLRESGWTGPVLYAEVGYLSTQSGDFDTPSGYAAARTSHVSFCWNGTHGLGFEYLPASVPSDRWDALCVALRPWKRNPNGKVLIMGQTEHDPVAIPPGESKAWNEQMVPLAEQVFGRGNVDFRPHPRYTDFALPPVHTIARGYRRAVTYSSTAAIETVVAGIPTQVFSPISMAWPMACHTFEEPEITPDREDWACKLAYRQWTHAECRSGEFWETIGRGINEPTDSRVSGV